MPESPETPETPEPGGEQSSAERPEAGLEPTGARPAEPVVTGSKRQGMFGVHGTGDTSGYGGVRLPAFAPAPA
jgi:NADH-quinone oxidoreductase subunit C